MINEILALVVSAILIIIGSIIASSVAEALQYEYSDVLIAAIIAILQTLPEYAFVIVLSMDGRLDLALASIIGANILLIALGFPLTVIIAYLARCKGVREDLSIDLMRENSLEAVFLAISGAYMIFIGIKGYLDIIDSVILFSVFIIYTLLVTRLPPEIEFEEPHGLARKFIQRKKLAAIVMVLSIVLVFLPAEIFADSIISIAQETLIVTEIFLVAIVAPIVSEMPEKLTAYIAATRSEDMARLGIANFMSSRINNGTLLISSMFIAAIVAGHLDPLSHIPVGSDIIRSLLILAGILSLIGALTTIDRRITLHESLGLIVVYVISIFALDQPTYIVPILVILSLITIFILLRAIKERRFYWLKDIKYTLELCVKKNG